MTQPTAARDVCALSAYRILEDGTVITGGTSVQDISCPEVDGVVRATLVYGGSVIRPISPNVSEMTLIILLDLGGTIPSAVLKFAATNGPLAIAQVRSFLPLAREKNYIDIHSLQRRWAEKNSGTILKEASANDKKPSFELGDTRQDVNHVPIKERAESLVTTLLELCDSPGWNFVKEVDWYVVNVLNHSRLI
jgi:hypothetical protein